MSQKPVDNQKAIDPQQQAEATQKSIDEAWNSWLRKLNKKKLVGPGCNDTQLPAESALNQKVANPRGPLWTSGTAPNHRPGHSASRPAVASSRVAGAPQGSADSANRPNTEGPAYDDLDDFDRGPARLHKGRLWNPDDDREHARPGPSTLRHIDPANVATNYKLHGSARPRRKRHDVSLALPAQPSQTGNRTPLDLEDEEPIATPLVREPDTRPISEDRLIAEIKGIYAGLSVVEAKGHEARTLHAAREEETDATVRHERWQALVALHRTLLHEYHDLLLATQHPLGNAALKTLPYRYNMPTRMWQHAIHSFLELLRSRMPDTTEHMDTFVFTAYSFLALLYETVPQYKDSWIECLADLGRYRMALEDEDSVVREEWQFISRRWYYMALDKYPKSGRLYHHLAILARPDPLQQLFYLSKAICAAESFAAGRETIMTLFGPLVQYGSQIPNASAADVSLVCYHGVVYSGKFRERLGLSLRNFKAVLFGHIENYTRRWLQDGYRIAIINACAMTGYANEANPVYCGLIKRGPKDESRDAGLAGTEPPDSMVMKKLEATTWLANAIHEIVLGRRRDASTLPYLHVTLVFLSSLSADPVAMELVARTFPWKLLACNLSEWASTTKNFDTRSAVFPQSYLQRPLPEDFDMRGIPFLENFLPEGHFGGEMLDDEELYFEAPSMAEERKERVLYLASLIVAQDGQWLRFDPSSRQFGVAPRFDHDPVLGKLPGSGVDLEA